VHKATFEPVPESARAAREFVRRCLPSRDGLDHETILLLASELASNAIIHAQQVFDVWVEFLPPGVRVGVDDPSPALPIPRQPGPLEIGGRGLAMIEALADRWGTEATPTGKRVWFQICG
jgi:anti-sigma regulatory factor (Ser/Thr protein kinase)